MYRALSPQTFLSDLERLAWEEKKQTPKSYTFYLEQIAKYSGLRPWSTLKKRILDSTHPVLVHHMDEALNKRVCQGLEKAVPCSVTAYAVKDARRLFGELDLRPTDEGVTNGHRGGESVKALVHEHFAGVYSPDLLAHMVSALEAEGRWVQNDLTFDFEAPGDFL